MTTNRKLLALGLLLIPVLTSASDSVNCDDLKYIGANRLSVLIGIQNANPAYRACVSTSKFTQASRDLDTAYSANTITDNNYRVQLKELNQNREELGYEEAIQYSNITARAFKRSEHTPNKARGSALSFGSLSTPIRTAPGYTILSGKDLN